MMSFAIHDYTSANRPWPVRMIVPFQRVLLRLLRPALDRLRDLLQFLHDKQQEQTEASAAVVNRLAVAETTSAQTLAAIRHQHTQSDQLADALSAARHHHAQTEQQQRDALQQLTQSHRALMQDHLALSRRIVMLENLLLQSTPDVTNESTLVGA